VTWQRLLAEPRMMKGLVGRESLIWIIFEQLRKKAVSVVTFKMPVLGPPVSEGHWWLPSCSKGAVRVSANNE
jgi:hypothetical protein